MKNLTILTAENASKVSTVISIANPEWGTKKFEFKGQPLLGDDFAHVVGSGSNGSVLFQNEMHFWAVASWK